MNKHAHAYAYAYAHRADDYLQMGWVLLGPWHNLGEEIILLFGWYCTCREAKKPCASSG